MRSNLLNLLLLLPLTIIFSFVSNQTSDSTSSRVALIIDPAFYSSEALVIIQFFHFSFHWSAGQTVRYTYPNSAISGGSSNYVRIGTFQCAYQLPDVTTWSAFPGTDCTEASTSTYFEFVVQSAFFNPNLIQSIKVRFGKVFVPNNSQLSYPGPTIVLNPTSSPQTYTGSDQYPKPVPITLSASLISDVLNPGSTASYTFVFKSTLTTIPSGSSIEISSTQEAGKPWIQFLSTVTLTLTGPIPLVTTTNTITNNEIKINSFNSAQILANNDITLVIGNNRNPIERGQTNSLVLKIRAGDGRVLEQLSSGLAISLDGNCILGEITGTAGRFFSSLTATTQTSVALFQVIVGIPYTEGQAQFVVTFPPQIQILTSSANCVGIQNNDISADPTNSQSVNVSRSCTISGQVVTFNAYPDPKQQIEILFENIRNARTTNPTSAFSLQTITSTSQISCSIDTVTATFTLSPLTVSTLTRSPSTLNSQAVTFTLKFSTTAQLLPTDKISILIPDSQMVLITGRACGNGVATKICSFTETTPSLDAVANNTITTSVSEWCAGTTCPRGTEITIIFTGCANPKWKVIPDDSRVTISFLDTTASDGIISSTTTSTTPSSFTPVITLTEFTNASISRTAAQNIVGESTTYTFAFTVTTPIQSTGQIRLVFPDLAMTSTSPTVSIGATSQTVTSTNNASGFLNQVTLTVICNSGCATGTAFTLTLSGVTNPGSTRPITNSFTIESFYNKGNGYLVDQSIVTNVANLALVPNALILPSIDSATLITGDINNYTIIATTKNPIPINGRFQVVFPAEIALTNSSSCSGVLDPTITGTLTCLITTSTRTASLTVPALVPASTKITLTVVNVRNPQSFRPSSTFLITTYEVDGANSYSIDQSSALTITMNVPNNLSGLILKRIPIIAGQTVPLVNKDQNHFFQFTLFNPIPQNGSVVVTYNSQQIVIPAGATLGVVESNTSNQVLTTSLLSGTVSDTTFTALPCSAAECAGSTTIYFMLTGAKTPASAILPPTKVKIETFTHVYTGEGAYKIDQVSNDFVLPVSYGPLNNLVIDRVVDGTTTQQDTVGQNVQLTATWVPTNNLLSGGQFRMWFSQKFVYQQGSVAAPTALECQFGKTGSTLVNAACSPTETQDDTSYDQKVVLKLSVTITAIIQSDVTNNTSFTVKIKNLQNPFNVNQARSGTIAAFTFQTSTNQTMNSGLIEPPNQQLPILTPGTLTPVTIARVSQQVVDQPVTLQFKITSGTKVVSGHSVIFYIPRPFFEVNGSTSPFTPTCSTSCQGSVTDSLITIIATNLICQSSFPCAAGTAKTFNITNGLKNAYNIASQTGSFTIRSTTENSTVFVDQYANTAYPVQPVLMPSTTTVDPITLGDNKAGEITTVTIPFTLGSRVLATDFLEIQFTTTDQLFKQSPTNTVSCTKILSNSAELAISSCVLTLDGVKITKVRANQFCSTSGCNSGQSYSLRINNVELLGLAKDVSVTVTVNTKTPNASGTDFQIGTGSRGETVTIIPNIFLNPKIEAVIEGACTTGEIEQICSMKFTMTTKNPFPTLANSGRLQVVIPTATANLSYLTLNAGSQTSACTTNTIGGDSTGVVCTISGSTVTLTHTSSSTDDQVIIIVVSHILLPNSTKPTLTFSFTSYSNTNLIDQLTTLTFIANPGSLTDPTVTRAATRIREQTQYVFQFTTTHNVPIAYVGTLSNFATVRVQLPPIAQIEFLTDTNLESSIQCTIEKKIGGVTQTLTPAASFQVSRGKPLETTVQWMRFTNVCRASALCPAGTQFTITCPSTIIRNKRYKKLDLDNITDSIQMGTSTPKGPAPSFNEYWFDAKIEGLFATPSLEPGELTVNSLARGGNKVSELVTLTSNVTPNFSSHVNTGKLIFNVNAGIFLDPDQNIQAVNSANSETIRTAQVFKQRASTNPVEIQLLAINDPCGPSTICPINVAFGYQVQYVKNPLVAITMPADPMEIYTATTEGYQLDRGYSLPLNQIFSALEGASFTSVKIWPEDPTVSRETPYDFIFKLDSSLPSTAYLDLKLSSTTITLLTPPTCTDLFDAANTGMACSIVTNASGDSVLRVTSIISEANATPPDLASGYFGVKVRNIRNPANTDAPGNLTAWVYIPAGVIAQGDYPVPAAKVAVADTDCAQECKTCSGTPNFCTSCVTPGQLPFNNGDTSTCLSSCGSNQFLNPIDSKCYECENSCQTCFGYRGKDCLTCVSPKHKSDSECVDNCPALTTVSTVNGISVCENSNSPSGCTAPCVTCSTSVTYCLTCNTATTTNDTINPLTGTCVSSTSPSPHQCSTGWYPITSGTYKSCAKCYYLCGTCNERADKCLSCLPEIYVQSVYNETLNTCSLDCVAGQYLGNTGCQNCNPICSTCSGRLPTQCQSCNQSIPSVSARLYLYQNQCVTQCPHPYSQNVNTNQCDNPPLSLSKSIPLFIEIPLLIGAIVMTLVSVCVVGSKSAKHGGGKFIWWNALYALISLIEFVNRFLLIGNLFDKRYPVHFAINFTVVFTSVFIGMLCHIFYFQPLTYISVFYSKLYKNFKCGFMTVIIFSYIGGSNVFRLISSKFLGVKSLSNTFGIYTFWIRPLEVFGWFMGALSIAQILLCIVMLATFPIYNDAFMCAILGIIWNTAIIVMQICTWVYVQKRYPLSKLDEEEAGLIDVQHPQYAKK